MNKRQYRIGLVWILWAKFYNFFVLKILFAALLLSRQFFFIFVSLTQNITINVSVFVNQQYKLHNCNNRNIDFRHFFIHLFRCDSISRLGVWEWVSYWVTSRTSLFTCLKFEKSSFNCVIVFNAIKLQLISVGLQKNETIWNTLH